MERFCKLLQLSKKECKGGVMIENKALQVEIHGLVASAKSLFISTNEDYDRARTIVSGMKKAQKEVNGLFDPPTKKLNEAKTLLLDSKKVYSIPLKEGIDIILTNMGSHEAKMKAKEEETQRNAEIEARKVEEAKREEEIKALKEAGMKEEAKAVKSMPVMVAPVFVEKLTPTTAGEHTRTKYNFRIINPNLIPRQYMKVDEVKIRQTVTALKENTKIAGIVVFPVSKTAGVK